MKRILILFSLLFLTSNSVFAVEQTTTPIETKTLTETVSASNETTDTLKVFSTDNKFFGLKNSKDEITVNPIYRKVIRLGKNAWLIQKKNYKFGLIDCTGKILVEPKYTHAERLFDTWVKLGNESDYGIYDQYGKAIVPPKFHGIEPLFGRKFLTVKNFKYGIYSADGKMLMDNKCQFIYMPSPTTMRIKYNNSWFEIEKISTEEAIALPDDAVKRIDDEAFRITELLANTGVGAGYSVVTTADYTLKIFSSISIAYEETIDELLLSQGLDTVSILMKASWLPKFPFVFVKKYCNNLVQPDGGPLSDVRETLLEQMK